MKGLVGLCWFALNVVYCQIPPVVYVSFQTNETSTHDALNDRVIINISDDTPLVEVHLPSIFPFFGEFIDRVFVSPNGYVQTSPVNLCGCCYCAVCRSDYFGMITGLLSDLNTFNSDSAFVSVGQDNLNVTTIYFNRVNFFGYLEPQLDFGIQLYPDGAIYIMYDNITHIDTLVTDPEKCAWLSGLIGPNINLTQGQYVVSEEQQRVQTEEWEARNLGVYPPSRSGVRSGSHYVTCPLSSAWACAPAVMDNTTAVLNITTLSMSCLAHRHDLNHSIQIAILISSSPIAYNTSAAAVDTDFVVECDLLSESVLLEPSPVSFMCNLSGGVNMSYFEGKDSLFIHILWKPSSSSSSSSSPGASSSLLDYRLLGSPSDIPPLVVNYTTTTTSAADSSSSSECVLNTPVGTCPPCDVMQSSLGPAITTPDLTCLDTECTLDLSRAVSEVYHTAASFSSFSALPSYQALYLRESCVNNSCEETFAYDLDRNGNCCLIADMDCKGVCNGTSVVGKDLDRGWTKCCSAPLDCLGYCGGPAVLDCFGVCAGSSVLDCQGVCNGTVVVDACGVCGGSDVLQCPPVEIGVDTGRNPLHSDHHLLAVFDASSPVFVSNIPLVVSNTNTVPVNVSFSYPEPHELPPFITLPLNIIYEIQPFSNVSFDVIANLSGLLYQQYNSWGVNTIDIK
jgi:hypothetical protein